MKQAAVRRGRPAGAIVGDALYTIGELRMRLDWSESALRSARRKGLKIHRCGRRSYAVGREVIDHIAGQPCTNN
jgi:hypothetical protein